MAAATRSLATALWGARFASGLLVPATPPIGTQPTYCKRPDRHHAAPPGRRLDRQDAGKTRFANLRHGRSLHSGRARRRYHHGGPWGCVRASRCCDNRRSPPQGCPASPAWSQRYLRPRRECLHGRRHGLFRHNIFARDALFSVAGFCGAGHCRGASDSGAGHRS